MGEVKIGESAVAIFKLAVGANLGSRKWPKIGESGIILISIPSSWVVNSIWY